MLFTTTIFASVSFDKLEKSGHTALSTAVKDSSWKKGSYSFNNDKIKVKMNNGKIQELYVDGNKIPATKISEYKNMVEQTLSNFIVKAPIPPAAPSVLENTKLLEPPKAPRPMIPDSVEGPDLPPPPEAADSLRQPGVPPTAPVPQEIIDDNFAMIELQRDTLADNDVIIKKQKERLEKLKNEIKIRQEKLEETRKTLEEKRIERMGKIKGRNETVKKYDKFGTEITKELIKRGAVSLGEHYDLELSNRELVVNGEKQPSELLQIGLVLYKKIWRKELKGNTIYKMNH